MKEQFVEDIADVREGEWIEDSFLIRGIQLSVRKDGKPYLMLKVGDKTGVIDCKIWDQTDEFINKFSVDDFVKIKGVITSYQGIRILDIADNRIELLGHFISIIMGYSDKVSYIYDIIF